MNSKQNGGRLPRPALPPALQADTVSSAVTEEAADLAEAARRRRIQYQIRKSLIRAEYRMKDMVHHPDGGRCTVEEAQREAVAERRRIEEDVRHGSRKHNRVARWQRHLPQFVLLFDFCLLLYFFAGITDVNWVDPMTANLGFAVVLAAMVTLLSYGFLSFTGHRLRIQKDHSGSVPIHELDGSSRAALVGAAVITVILAALMFTRMRTEVLYALGPSVGGTAIVIALTLAVVSAAANVLVVMIHAHDGSQQVDRLNKLSAAAHPGLTRAHRMRERAAHQASR